MRFSLQVQYAICGVFDLAYNGQGEPVQVRVISERQAIPVRYLEQIFQRLRRGGVVTSKRGPGGGYTLARSLADLTLHQVVEAVEGPLDEAFEMDAPESAGAGTSFRPDFLWLELSELLGTALASVTLESLCHAAASARVPRAESQAPMWFI
jgi:Rrf2 family iron-sulfur cluster assembly transcriptional regulator